MEPVAVAGSRRFRWNLGEVMRLYLVLTLLAAVVLSIPSSFFESEAVRLGMTLGLIGIWRYGWWFVHFIRAQIYARVVFPPRRQRAEQLWKQGWRPRKLHFLMTTYKENRETTDRVLASIVQEARAVGVPTTLHIGLGDPSDELVIQEFFANQGQDLELEVIMVRQNKPGKRFALGLALRAMARAGVDGDDPVVFMDGDTLLEPGCMRCCLPFFAMNKRLQALTTDEKVIVHGPRWVQNWLDMRFAQRHLAMQSHALSNKVLTLTGRMSVFRARNVVKQEFIRTVEADHLDHWLWGEFRFLSGDDKSTWYWLLKAGAELTYIPDALAITIERIEGNGRERMFQNMLRWSGNILRNGARAISLGPKRVGWFIWWCLVDQRIAMWTTLIGPLSAIILSLYYSPLALLAYLLWVCITRSALALVLYGYAGRINLWFPVFLYCNQVLNALIKIYISFRLPKQRWMNRGDQKAYQTRQGMLALAKHYMASYLTTLWLSVMSFVLMIFLGVVRPLPLERLI